MERTRRLTKGTLSELFGDKTIAVDEFTRTLGYRRAAEEAWEYMHNTKS
jgi:penicillin amidase